MFEIAVVSIVALAVGYWVTLWLMGRHDDVLHGDFVHENDREESAAEPQLPAEAFPHYPPFPKRPKIKSAVAGPAAVKIDVLKTDVARPASAEQSPMLPATPIPSEQSDTLRALLASIKRDLKDASQL